MQLRVRLLRCLLAVLYRALEFVSDRIFRFVYRDAGKAELPAIEDRLVLESGVSLARKIRTGQVPTGTRPGESKRSDRDLTSWSCVRSPAREWSGRS